MNKTLRNLALVALVAAPFSAFADIKGAGTEADPYQIATVEDLEGAWKLTKAGETVYFVQTADIDMTGVTGWHAFVGFDNVTYSSIINYDGCNHVIKNFKPENAAYDSSKQNCYNGSIFGVLNGTLKNLGIVDVDIETPQGGGAVCGYAGHSTGSSALIENVYATGKIKGTSYLGGLCGTTGNDVTIKNCFVNITLEGTGATAAFVGRQRNPVTINNSYAAGTVTGATAALAVFTDKTNMSVTVNDVVLFNSGVNDAVNAGVTLSGEFTMANTSATKAAGIAAVQAWPAFSATENVDGFPALEYTLAGEGTEANPYIIDSAKALCNAYRYAKIGEFTYFKQTADIDMAGVEAYSPIVGYDNGGNEVEVGGKKLNSYNKPIDYNGGNHVIKNFAPTKDEYGTAAQTNYSYGLTIFGVLVGNVYDLGVVDADINAGIGRAGILAAYLGYGTLVDVTKVQNVFVTGTMASAATAGKYVGGMFGTTGSNAFIENCFVNIDLALAGAVKGGAIIATVSKDVELQNVYAAGTVEGNANLLFGSGAASVYAENVIAFNAGTITAAADADVEGVEVATAATKAQLIKDIQTDWEEFSATKFIDGYPILKSFEAYGVDGEQSGIFDAAVEDGSDAPAVYYNLQGVQVNNPENGIYIVRRGNKVTKEVIR